MDPDLNFNFHPLLYYGITSKFVEGVFSVSEMIICKLAFCICQGQPTLQIVIAVG